MRARSFEDLAHSQGDFHQTFGHDDDDDNDDDDDDVDDKNNNDNDVEVDVVKDIAFLLAGDK